LFVDLFETLKSNFLSLSWVVREIIAVQIPSKDVDSSTITVSISGVLVGGSGVFVDSLVGIIIVGFDVTVKFTDNV